jgi:hypothetical protein
MVGILLPFEVPHEWPTPNVKAARPKTAAYTIETDSP